MVERFEFTCADADPETVSVNGGRWVRYSDYAALEAELAALREGREQQAVAAEQVDYPRILYVCEHCQENAPEMCGRARDDLYVTPSGTWLCDECRDEEGVPISDCVPPPALYPAAAIIALQRKRDSLALSAIAEEKAKTRALGRAEATEARLAEALKALEPFALVAEHDIGEDESDNDLFRPLVLFNRAPRIRVGHLRAALAVVREAK